MAIMMCLQCCDDQIMSVIVNEVWLMELHGLSQDQMVNNFVKGNKC